VQKQAIRLEAIKLPAFVRLFKAEIFAACMMYRADFPISRLS